MGNFSVKYSKHSLLRSVVLATLLASTAIQGAVAQSSSALSEKAAPLVTEAEAAKAKPESTKTAEAKPEAHAEEPKDKKAKKHKPAKKHHGSKLSDEPARLLTEDEIPKRAGMLLEKGEPFLGTGNLSPGITLPTGAIWQPALWVFGDIRSTVGHFDNGVAESRQFFSNRLDLFANLKLSPTERILLGISPLSRHRRDHTGVLRRQSTGFEFFNGFNANIETLFFEGEFGEIFPNLDPDDNKAFDFGFSIGRQPIFFQEGMLVNDSIDSIALTRDTIAIPGITPDLRITALFGLHDIDRDDNSPDGSARLIGLFTETDLRKSTVNLDGAYVFSNNSAGGDSVHLGASAIQRIGHFNTAFRVNASFPTEASGSAVDDGILLFGEVSRTATGSENIMYANAFWGINNFSSAARDRAAGGPLGNTGILFAAPAASLSGSPLSNRADDVVGGAIGYQMFFNHEKTQLTLELGGRKDTNGVNQGAVAFGGQFLHALNNRTSLQVDAFVSEGQNREIGTGLRAEIRTRF